MTETQKTQAQPQTPKKKDTMHMPPLPGPDRFIKYYRDMGNRFAELLTIMFTIPGSKKSKSKSEI